MPRSHFGLPPRERIDRTSWESTRVSAPQGSSSGFHLLRPTTDSTGRGSPLNAYVQRRGGETMSPSAVAQAVTQHAHAVDYYAGEPLRHDDVGHLLRTGAWRAHHSHKHTDPLRGTGRRTFREPR
eukprot:scaffold2008_cov283-Pinguiococcus_pyrenoidosus.AAC.18